ncbi:MAG: DUF1579 family protein [Phycisphaerales bacterium]
MRSPHLIPVAALMVATVAGLASAWAVRPSLLQQPPTTQPPAPAPTEPTAPANEAPDLRRPIDDARKQIEESKRAIQDALKKPGDAAAPARGTPPALDQQLKLSAPGAEHDLLRAFAGTFRGQVRSSFSGESLATSVNSMIYGDRFLRLDFTGFAGDYPITGVSYWGYDRAKKKYTTVSIDSLSTGTLTTEGEYDAGSRTITSAGDLFDPAQGKLVRVRQVIRRLSDDEFSFELFAPGKDGKETSAFRALYTRERR